MSCSILDFSQEEIIVTRVIVGLVAVYSTFMLNIVVQAVLTWGNN